MSLEDLFPGFDYIGPSRHDGLRVAIPAGASAVRVSLECACPEILNLGQIKLVDSAGRDIPLADPSIDVRLSSVYNDDPTFGRDAVRKGAGIHTKVEFHPSLEIEWRDKAVAFIEVLNRSDKFGRRSASLAITARVRAEWQRLYRHHEPARVVGLLSRIRACVPSVDLLSPRDMAHLRKDVMAQIADLAHRRPDTVGDYGWILPLLDIYGGGDEIDVQLLSLYFAGVLRGGGSISHLAPAWRILSSSAALLESEREVNGFLHAAGVEAGYIYTRHGLRRSKLLSKADDYIRLARSVIDVLAGDGIESFISYGTLLGAVRDKAFIAHDDDMDVVYVGNADVQGGLDERQRVMESLARAGFVIESKLPLLNVEVSERGGDVSVDLFPSWRGDGTRYMYMQGMAVGPVELRSILPLGSIEFYGVRFPAPADPEWFLNQRYGSSWGVSDRFFEWPYPLAS